ncbi:MAG: GIY-YIG nuclease family protein [Bacteroidota bacterium]
MIKFGTVTFSGKSGTSYEFFAYSTDTEFNAVAGVYVVTRRTLDNSSHASHTRIYVGQTEDLSVRFDNHHKADCFKKHKANCICIYREDSEGQRLAIEQDLIEKYNPPCNG